MSTPETKTKRKIALKKNKEINKIWHPESGLVFKSSKEKLVIGRVEDGEVIPLDDDALDLCTQWKFKYDTSLVEEVDEDEEEEGDEAEADEEEHENVDEPVKPKNDEELGEEEGDTENGKIVSVIDENPEVVHNEPVQNLDTNLETKLAVAFTDMETSTKLLRKNMDMIVNSVQQKADVVIANLTKDLADTKASLAQMTADCEEAKAKFAKIRSALGL
jgi:hypothetical protein